jgi:hypothetical protein
MCTVALVGRMKHFISCKTAAPENLLAAGRLFCFLKNIFN